MSLGLDENKKKYVVILVLLVLGSAITVNAVYSPLAPQWEISATLSRFTVNGIDYADNQRPADTQVWGLSHVRFDVDEWATGAADLDISLTNPAHVIIDPQTGKYETADDDEIFYQYSKVVGGMVIFYDQHVYTFWVTGIASPDIYEGVAGWGATVEARNGAGEIAGLNIYVHFVADAWEIGPASWYDNGSVYNKAEGWYGVMSASVLESYAGLVDKSQLEQNGEDWDSYDDAEVPTSGYHAEATETGAVNMYTVNDSSSVPDLTAAVARNDTIQGVPTEIELSLYGELLPGYTWPPGGSISTSAVMFQYKVRVDVLVSAGYVLASGQQEDDYVPPKIDDVGSDPIGLLWASITTDGFALFQFIIFVLVIILLIRFAPVIIAIVKRILGRGD